VALTSAQRASALVVRLSSVTSYFAEARRADPLDWLAERLDESPANMGLKMKTSRR
jgi:hypothetical protein